MLNSFNSLRERNATDDEATPHQEPAVSESKAQAEHFTDAGTSDAPGVLHLASALEHAARLLGATATPDRFAHALPMRAGHLSLNKADEAAAKIGLATDLVNIPLDKASPLAPPFVGFKQDGQAVLVTALDLTKDEVTIVDFDSGKPVELTRSLQQASAETVEAVLYLAKRPEKVSHQQSKGASTPHWFWSAAKKFKLSYAQVIMACLLVNILALAAPLFIMNVYDRVIPNLTIPTLWALAAGVAIAIGLDFLLKLVRAQVVDETGRRIDMAVSGRVFDHLLEVRSDARPNTTGILASHVRDFDNVRDVLTSTSVIALTDALFVFIFLAALAWIVGPLAAVPAAAALLILAFTASTQWPMARAMRQAQSDSSKRHGILVETLMALDRIKVLGGGATLRRRFDHSVAESSRSATVARFWSTLNTTVLQTASQAVTVIIVVWGVFLVLDAQVSVGALIAANILAGRVLAPLASVASTLQRLQNARFSYQAVDNLMKLPTEWTNAEATRELKNPSIQFKQVSHQYPDTAQPALDNVTLSIEAGDRVGIIGRVGSGKSTLGRLLSGLSQPTSGTITIDDVDSQQIPPAQLRKFVGYVGQNPDLISGTLRENLTLGSPQASVDDIDRAIHMAGLESLARSHPLGLSMPIQERGQNLSGGQRHAVALAQALMVRPKILFVDEPTAAMDTATERTCLQNLQTLSLEDKVTLLIATHSQTALRIVSKLAVLEAGRLAAFGARDEVLTALENQTLANQPKDRAA